MIAHSADSAGSGGSGTSRLGRYAGQMAFGALFVFVLPAGLVAWTAALDRRLDWPVPDWRPIGAVIAAAGASVMVLSMFQLSRRGRGLPMSAYPPRDLVTSGMYAVCRHPIYVGTGLLAAGIALLAASPGGVYVVTPTLCAAMVAYVVGFEQPGLVERFGDALRSYAPLLSLPSPGPERLSVGRRAALTLVLVDPLLAIGYLADRAQCGVSCTQAPGWWAGTGGAPAWVLAWVMPALIPAVLLLTAATGWQARRWTIALLVAGLGAVYLNVVLRAFGVDTAAVAPPAVAAAALLALALAWESIWRSLLSGAQRVANSRTDWLFFGGHFRVISHAIFAGLAGAVAIAIGGTLLDSPGGALLLLVFPLVGAALFAQVLWGNRTTLLRPFGYWGGVLGAAVGAGVVWVAFDISPVRALLACALAVPAAQCLGRLRCLTQGCCHGITTGPEQGIVVVQPQSRVVMLSGLGGRPILPTQLYSILFNLALGPLLFALYRSETVGMTVVIGLYLVLSGIERFAEDAFRGEKQTRWQGPLRENQWIAGAAAVVGGLISAVPSDVAGVAGIRSDAALIAAVVAGGPMTALALSMDFPTSRVRFSRLSG